MSHILVVAPHPDDETLGCGGTLLRHKNAGDTVHWLIVTSMFKDHGFSDEIIECRKNEIERVNDAYGFESKTRLDFKSTQLDTYPLSEIIKKIGEVISRVSPDVIYLPFRGDAHSDHAVTYDAVTACTKPFRNKHIKNLRVYETLSETEFSTSLNPQIFGPNLWINVTDHIEEKIAIMKIYESEMDRAPFPRSVENIRALATFRGCRSSVMFAESFISVMELID